MNRPLHESNYYYARTSRTLFNDIEHTYRKKNAFCIESKPPIYLYTALFDIPLPTFPAIFFFVFVTAAHSVPRRLPTTYFFNFFFSIDIGIIIIFITMRYRSDRRVRDYFVQDVYAPLRITRGSRETKDNICSDAV